MKILLFILALIAAGIGGILFLANLNTPSSTGPAVLLLCAAVLFSASAIVDAISIPKRSDGSSPTDKTD